MNEDHPVGELRHVSTVYEFEMNLLLPENECPHGALPGETHAACACFKALRGLVA